MSEGTLYDKVWEDHRVTTLPNGQDQLFIGMHLIHEVTSPQAFGMIDERGLDVAYPELTHATVDHIIPTRDQSRPLSDDQAETMMSVLEDNVADYDIAFDDPSSGNQGIVHVIGPEQGLTQPGM
ncbi:MAG: aconitase family protein, partial [Halobacteriales archaeon]|nr:aconitase family protein [Halobacteriales archaeon]